MAAAGLVLSVVGFVLSVVALAISTLFAVRTERRYRRIDRPELAIELGRRNQTQVGVTLRFVKGSHLATDVQALVRLQHRLWYGRATDLGPGRAEVSIVANYTNEPDLPPLGLPRRPFMEDAGTSGRVLALL